MYQVRFPPPWNAFLKVSSTNYIADLSILKQCINSEQYNSFKKIVRFLQRHPLHYALTASPKVMYSEMLKEFWNTCEYHPFGNYIRGYVCSGRNLIRVTITITIKGLRDTLKLSDKYEFDPQVSDVEAKEVHQKVQYFRNGIQKYRLATWKYLSDIVMQSFGGELSTVERQIFHSLVAEKYIDYAELIFNELKKKVLEQQRDVYVPYPRFLSLVFQKTMGNNYTQADDLESITPKVAEFWIFNYVEVEDAELTIISDSEAASSDSEADASDSETDSSYHSKSTSSLSNSSNPTLGGMSKVIPPKSNPTPPSETSSQLSKYPSRNKPSDTKTSDKRQLTPSKVVATTATLEAIAGMDIDNHEPNQDAYFTPSPSHNHHSSPNPTQQDRPTDTSAILQAIKALTSKVDTISSKVDTFSSDVESVKSSMAILQTNTTIQHNILAQELATLKYQIQSHVSCSLPSHSSAQCLTSQMSALESGMKAINHTLHTLQDNTTTSDINLTKGIDEIKTQHFCFSVQLENFQNLQLKVHTAALNTETAVHNLNNLCVSQPAFNEVQSGVVISKYLLDILNDQVKILARATTSQKPSQQSAIPSSNEDDSETVRLLRKRNVEKPAQEEPGFKKQVTLETQRKTKGKNIMPVAQPETDAIKALFELKEKREAVAFKEI